MDTELGVTMQHLKLAIACMDARHTRLSNSRTKLSRHYNKLQHTRAALQLLEEVLGMLYQDPDRWDDEPDLVPF